MARVSVVDVVKLALNLRCYNLQKSSQEGTSSCNIEFKTKLSYM